MRQINLLIVLMIGILLTACQPSTPPATSVTSNDSVGGISLSFPAEWTVFAEKSPIAGRQNVTLVRFPAGQEDLNIDQFPVIRVSYEDRNATSLVSGSDLETVAMGKAVALAPRALFDEPVLSQIDIYTAVSLKGENSSIDRQYYFVFVDFESEGGLVTLALTAPGDITDYEEVVHSIANTIRLTIKPKTLAPTISPEETAFIVPEQTGLFGPPESTSEVAPESTADVESTAEVAPESTGEVAPEATGEVAPEATGEVAATEEAAATDEALAGTREAIAAASTVEFLEIDPADAIFLSPTPEPDAVSQTLTLANGFTLVTLEGWKSKIHAPHRVELFQGVELEPGYNLAVNAIPAGTAEIHVTIGSIKDILGSAVDPNNPLESLIGANHTYIREYGEINEFEINGQPAASVLATSPNYDWYILLIEQGGGVTSGLLLYAAPGEAEALIPQVLALAESLSPAQQ